MELAVNINLQLELTTEEEPIQQRVESPVRGGRTLNPMIMNLPMWEITTIVGIQLEVMRVKFGALPTILIWNTMHVQFPFVLR